MVPRSRPIEWARGGRSRKRNAPATAAVRMKKWRVLRSRSTIASSAVVAVLAATFASLRASSVRAMTSAVPMTANTTPATSHAWSELW